MLTVTMRGEEILLEGEKIGTIEADGSFCCPVVSAEFVAHKLNGQPNLPVGAVLFLARMDADRLRRAA